MASSELKMPKEMCSMEGLSPVDNFWYRMMRSTTLVNSNHASGITLHIELWMFSSRTVMVAPPPLPR